MVTRYRDFNTKYACSNPTSHTSISGVLINSSILDYIPPWFLNTPGDVIVDVDPQKATAIVHWEEPIATDNSGQIADLTKSHSSGQRFSIGGTTVTYTATDPSDNTVTLTFLVIVIGKMLLQIVYRRISDSCSSLCL